MIIGLAPMAGFTDYAFRALCRKRGATLTVTEMIAAEALVHGSGNAKKMLKAESCETTQLFGCKPASLAKAASMAKTGWVELNAGCPEFCIVKTGSGSALLKNLPLLKECISALASERKKASVKIRLGWSKDNGVKIAKACEKAGAERIAVHGRTQEQGYTGKADWKAIAKIVDAVSIPVLGNGDVISVADGIEKAKTAGCAGFLAGRAAQGNPGFFDSTGIEFRKTDFLAYAKTQRNFNRLKLQALAFSKGLPGATELRVSIAASKTRKPVLKLFATT